MLTDSWSVWRSGLIPTLLLWLLNVVIIAFVLARLFIFGEPVTNKNSEASTAYWRHRNQAEQDSARVNDKTLQFFSVNFFS